MLANYPGCSIVSSNPVIPKGMKGVLKMDGWWTWEFIRQLVPPGCRIAAESNFTLHLGSDSWFSQLIPSANFRALLDLWTTN